MIMRRGRHLQLEPEFQSGCNDIFVLKKYHFFGPRGPLVLPLVDPVARAKNLDHVYTGIHAL